LTSVQVANVVWRGVIPICFRFVCVCARPVVAIIMSRIVIVILYSDVYRSNHRRGRLQGDVPVSSRLITTVTTSYPGSHKEGTVEADHHYVETDTGTIRSFVRSEYKNVKDVVFLLEPHGVISQKTTSFIV
jgi:hypothetical protein